VLGVTGPGARPQPGWPTRSPAGGEGDIGQKKNKKNTEPVRAYEVVVLDLAWAHDLLTGRRARWRGSTEKE
jgi:hypothetical protein